MRSARLTFVLALSLMSPESGQDGPAPLPSSGFDEQEALRSLRARIAGREDAPAGEVFQNVKVLSAVPAKRLLAIMQVGYARSLGVSCDHCHDPGDFASDARAPKRIARAMWEMTRELNERTLPAIPISIPPTTIAAKRYRST